MFIPIQLEEAIGGEEALQVYLSATTDRCGVPGQGLCIHGLYFLDQQTIVSAKKHERQA